MNIPIIASANAKDNNVSIKLLITAELDAFIGHFDSVSIVPGVVQIEWVLFFGKKYFDLPENISVQGIDSLKFHHVIQPGDQIQLDMELQAERLLFSFSSGDKKHSSGKLSIVN